MPFAKYYTVWLEIEEHDTDPDAVEEYTDVSGGIDGAGLDTFATLEEAEALANALTALHEAGGLTLAGRGR